MTINGRIKELRKQLGFNQTVFGEKIGIKVSQASYIEKDGNSVTKRVIQLICTTFNVSEKWLTEGTGEMYNKTEESIIQLLRKEYSLTPEQEIFARQWLALPTDVKDAVVDYVVQVAQAIKEQKGNDEAILGNASPPAANADKKISVPESGTHPDELSDDEWELIKAARREKARMSGTSVYTSSDMKNRA